MLFDWLVVGQIMPTNPAHSVRGPKRGVKRGKTPVLTREETRKLLDSIDTDTIPGLRDRALIGVLVYSFARIERRTTTTCRPTRRHASGQCSVVGVSSALITDH
jgi:site-specific recombinase XerC